MKLGKKIVCVGAGVLFLGFAGSVSAQQLTISGGAGVSWPSGEHFDDWHPGYAIESNDFIWVADRFGIGARGAFNRWSPHNVGFNQEIWEIIPSVRVRTDFPESPLNVFGQGGFGMYITKSVNGFPGGGPSALQEGPWIGRWGFSIGAGISIGSSKHLTLDIFPLYNLVLSAYQSGQAFSFFSGNACISLNI